MSADSTLQGLRLLVVEDEALVAMMLEVMLEGFGCDVVGVAGTLARGLTYAENEALVLDGAILDVNLGGEYVYPVAERLVARGVPIIFCTGYGPKGVSANFAHVPTLAKPYLEDDLQHLLTSVLANVRCH